MQPFLDAIRALGKKPIVAALLSFLFPGLGQAAAGQRSRGLIVSIPMFAVIGAFLFILIFDRSELFGLAVNQQWLTSLLVLDLVALIYHIWAVVDSYLVASNALPKKRRGTGPPRSSGKWAATLGILVILSGTVAIHGSVAKVDMDWQHALYCLTAKIPCWVTDNVGDPNSGDNGDDTGISDVPTDSPDASGSHGSPTPMPTYDFSNIQTFNPTKDAQAWDSDRELNILLLGLGVQKGSSANKLGPDTIMVLHIGLDSGNAEMISVGRNNTCTPLPTQEIAQHYASSSNGCPAYTFGPMLFNIPNEILGHCDKWPIPEFQSTCGQSNDENRYVRAYKGFEMTIGNLLGIHIDGSMWTNPLGLTTLIDVLPSHGVTITVDQKMVDQPCGYSKDPSNGLPDKTYQMGTQTVFDAIGKPYCPDPTHWGYFVPTGPAGVQKMQDQAASSNGGLTVIPVPGHPYDVAFIIRPGTYKFNGDWALAYARTRIFLPNGDFDRAAHQQILLKSMKKGLDPCTFASLSNVGPILSAVQAVPYGFNSDLDVTNPQNLQAWAGLAKFLTKDISQLVLKPSTVGMSGYAWDPKSIANARQKVKDYFLPAATTSGGGGSNC